MRRHNYGKYARVTVLFVAEDFAFVAIPFDFVAPVFSVSRETPAGALAHPFGKSSPIAR
jgi:hypothetical protein